MYLTSSERRLFDGLSDAIREGWEVIDESDAPDESPEIRRMRLHLVQLHDPRLQHFIEEARSKDSVDSIVAHIGQMNLESIMDSDLAELFFALGAGPISTIVSDLLQDVKTDADLQDIEALTVIRHELFISSTAS